MVMAYSRRSRFEWASEELARFLKISGGEPPCRSAESIAGEIKICQMFRPNVPFSAGRTRCRWSAYKGLARDWFFRTEGQREEQQPTGFQRLTRTSKD